MKTNSGSANIKLTEYFFSTQGEGKFVGVPSVFIRVFGCNKSCSGFGQPRGSVIPIEEMPHNTFDVGSVNSIEELPVFDIGCDSSAAWSKKYAHLSKDYTMGKLTEEVTQYNNNKRKIPHLVITGGEPLLPKYQKFWSKWFLDDSFPFDFVTFETNGTKVLLPELRKAIQERQLKYKDFNLTFSVSPKLSISGETFESSIIPQAVNSYCNIFDCPLGTNRGETYLKFVVRDELCLEDVNKALDVYQFTGNVYLMPEGATDKGLSITERAVADMALDNGFYFSPRLHIQLYGNSWGT